MAKCHNCDFCPNNAAKRDELSEPAAVVAEDEEAPELADVEGQCAKGCFTSYMACMRRPDGNIKVCRGAMCRSQCLKCSFCKHPDA
ncbi:hypothetical protein BU26DRAFT_522135 [Trematosphaeria pertusa]|uniref:Uncharacterized protein n=1 Tax=Trematosphaeria pertusa TaxID=390896 RepID=A0A6A6I8A4_9PLEO|nr:uncharacterized protein BU26DRAFT_522135 [Trematosphaeria pertusa]KAF2245750.1 hypothetical protein BU26DRAFT_522135 [Trematosphaeria pertusa]